MRWAQHDGAGAPGARRPRALGEAGRDGGEVGEATRAMGSGGFSTSGRDGVITPQHYHTLYIVSTAHGAPSSRRGLMLTRGRDLVDHVRSN